MSPNIPFYVVEIHKVKGKGKGKVLPRTKAQIGNKDIALLFR